MPLRVVAAVMVVVQCLWGAAVHRSLPPEVVVCFHRMLAVMHMVPGHQGVSILDRVKFCS